MNSFDTAGEAMLLGHEGSLQMAAAARRMLGAMLAHIGRKLAAILVATEGRHILP